MDLEQQKDNSETLVKAMRDMAEFKHSSLFVGMLDYMTNRLETNLRERETYFNTLAVLRDNYITNGIYDILCNDIFLSSGIEEYFTVEVTDNPELTADLKEMMSSVGLYEILLSVLPELLHYGAYPLKPVFREGKGLVALLDDYDPSQVVPIYSADNIPLFYFVSRQKRQTDNGFSFIDYSKRTMFDYEDVSNVFYLSSDATYLKLELPEKIISQFRSKLPDNIKSNNLIIKQPKSFIWPARDKLKDTLILEKVAIAKSIAKSLSPTVIGVPVPASFDPNKLVELTKKYSDIINGNSQSMSNLETIDLALKEIGQVKVIPVAGDKAIPQPLDTGSRERVIPQEDIDVSLRRTLNTLSIPADLFTGDQDSKANRTTNVRYAKRLKRIRKDIARSLSILCLMHIGSKFKDKDVKLSDIKIFFKNNINNDELENIESQDLIISSVSSMVRLFDEIEHVTSSSDYVVDANSLMETIKDSLSSIGSGYGKAIVRKSVDNEDNRIKALNMTKEDDFE